tara:strand:+ start:31 stop:285 length:255 start_codon:yes stop_codon:yes gene_type:complete
MGKKRRLNRGTKFRLKHANHPRTQLLSDNVELVDVVPVVIEAAQVEATLSAVLEEEAVEVVPEVVIPRKTVRKSTKKRAKSTTR